MKREPLPRKRKQVINPWLGDTPPEEDFIEPIVKTKRVITGFRIGESETRVTRSRKAIKGKIKEKYPQTTDSQLDDAAFAYENYHVTVELRQYSKADRSTVRKPL